MNGRDLVWVRHGPATPDPATPADAWPLTPEGREATARLASSLAGLAPPLSVVTSSERKAVETAATLCTALGLGPARVAHELREVQRPWTAGDYHAAARTYLRSGSTPGWEPGADVLRRLSRGLAEHRSPEGTTIAVGHGLAISIWAADITEGLDSVEFWDNLTFPDAWLFTEDRRMSRRIAG